MIMLVAVAVAPTIVEGHRHRPRFPTFHMLPNYQHTVNRNTDDAASAQFLDVPWLRGAVRTGTAIIGRLQDMRGLEQSQNKLFIMRHGGLWWS